MKKTGFFADIISAFKLLSYSIRRPRILQHGSKCGCGQVQTREVASFRGLKLRGNSEPLRVAVKMLEVSIVFFQFLQRYAPNTVRLYGIGCQVKPGRDCNFAEVSKWRVAEIVKQACGLHKRDQRPLLPHYAQNIQFIGTKCLDRLLGNESPD